MMTFKKNLIILLIGLFLVMVGFGITLPLLPFYIQKLSIAEGISSEKIWLHVGLITGSYPLIQFLFSPYLGSLSDKIGRRPLILWGLFGYSITMFLFSISGSIFLLYLFRLLSGLFSAAFLTASSAYIADKTTEKTRGGGMALLVSATGLGAVAGPLIGNLFSKATISFDQLTFDRFSLPFTISAILVLIVCLFLFFALSESKISSTRQIIQTKKITKESIFSFLRTVKKSFIFLLIFSFISQLSLAMFEGTFALHSQRLFAFGPKQMSIVFIVCGSVMGLLQLGPVNWLIKKKGEGALLPYGLVMLSIGMSLLMLSNKMEFILLFVSFISIGMAILTPCLASLITKDSGKKYGTTLGIFSSVNSLGQVLGVVIGSVIMIWFVHLPYFIISVLLLIIAALCVPKFRLKILHF
ncbi:MAG: MFS transporter [Mucilaginibacter sp.]|uniref:MFS transporter n=1 Tax=Mucilaginibacter sp. TaxID=1882438 RepID=UPI003264DE8E